MSKQRGPVYYTGTIDGICYYKMNGKYYARRKSTLSRKRVRRDPTFARTRRNAELLGQASRVAAGVYRLLPRVQKKLDLYRAMTGQAMEMFKKGASEVEVKERLELAVKKGVQVKVSKDPVVRLQARTGGMSVVRTVWRRSGKGMMREKRGNEMGMQVWTVMTREKVYEVKLEEVKCLSS
ncbi:MAG TPA: hypothetical protein VGD35_04545 [Chitinophaga sp.]